MKTDRQTDKFPDKTRHWNSAVFNDAHPTNWDALNKPPPGWKIYTKKEICPETGREHMQTHVDCGTQQRLSALTKWIQSHWKMVIGEEYIKNSIAYVSKTETTAPGAISQIIEGEKYMQFHEILLTIANASCSQFWYKGEDIHNSWSYVTTNLVERDLKWANKLSNPSLEKCWKLWYMAFCEVATQASSFIIEEEATPIEDWGQECFIED